MNLQEKEKLLQQSRYSMQDLLEIMAELRSETGCEWDRAQTHASIRRCLLEEAYEVAEAIDLDEAGSLCEELGDLLFQVVFHARIEEEKGRFSFDDVADAISRKMIERHPHVFAHPGSEAPDWNMLKIRKRGQTKLSQRLEEIPKALPALMRADKLLDRMEQHDCVLEEYTACASDDTVSAHDRVGDELLAYIAECRKMGIDCERALADACDRLTARVKGSENERS